MAVRSLREKLRVAWFSPLNLSGRATNSLAAYATDELLPHLREEFDIDLYHQGFEVYQDFPTYNYLSAYQHHREQPYDVIFYQLEDKKLANFMRVHVGLMPGIVWFHDLLFSNFGPEPILNSPWRQVIGKFNGKIRDWPQRGEEFEQQGPLGYREAAWAVVPIFSNPVALNEYRRNVDIRLDADSDKRHKGYFIPLPVSGRPSEHRSSDVFRIVFAGTPRIENRAHKLLQAITELDAKIHLTWLLEADEKPAAHSLIEEYEVADVDIIEGRTPRRWQELVSNADCAVHLHFSVYGQPEPYLGQSLMAGLPVLVTRFGPTEYLPENIVFKVDAGEHEVFQIREVIARLLQGASPAIHDRVRSFALNYCRSEACAAELSTVFKNEAINLLRFESRWSALEAEASADLVKEARAIAGEDEIWERLMRPGFEELGFL